MLVRTGLLACRVIWPDGRANVIELLRPGDVAVEPPRVGVPPQRPRAPFEGCVEWRAMVSSDVLVLAGARVASAIESDPGLRGWLLERMGVRLAGLREALAIALELPVAERLERFLDDVAAVRGRPVGDGVEIALDLTQETLAEAVGASRETVNRALAALGRRGRVHRSGLRYTMLTPKRGGTGRHSAHPAVRPGPRIRA